MEQTTAKRRRLNLQMKSVISIIMISVIFTIALIMFNYVYYKNKSFEYHRTSALNLAKTVAYLLDGDRIEEYAETLQKDRYYVETFEMLRELQEKNNIEYLYIEKINIPEKNVVYIMDTDPVNPYALGESVQFAEENTDKTMDEILMHPFVSETEAGWLCSALAPVKGDSQQSVAVGVDLSMNHIRDQMKQMLLNAIIIAVLIAAIMIALSVILIKSRIVTPISRLSMAASCYDSGKLLGDIQSELSRLENHTGDEIEELTVSVQKMESDIKKYVQDLTSATIANERISAELNIATNIQAAMLPSVFPAFPDRSDFDLYATMRPAKEVGGDFYDYFLLDYDHLAFIAADVSGKGVPAALFMVIAKTLIRNQAQFGLPPEKVFGKVNMQLCENNKASMFVTAWMGVLELSTGIVRFANAGHTRPVIVRKDGSAEYLVSRAGFVLAGMEMIQYKQGEVKLEPGDSILLYTDGVTEATNAQEELYGEPRLLETVRENPGNTPKELIETVNDAVDAFVKEAPQFDDITLLAVKYLGEGSDVFTQTRSFIASKPELEQVLAWLNGHLEAYQCPEKIQKQLDIAVEEVFVNVASYAYPQGTSTVDITLNFAGTPTKLEITFADRGIPYDPLKKKDPNVKLSLEERQPGGLGVFIVKKTMDSVSYRYENGQNILKVVKTLSE